MQQLRRSSRYWGIAALAALAIVWGLAGADSTRMSAQQSFCDGSWNQIVCENSLPGSPKSEWDVVGAGDTSIQGFATDISVNRGQTVAFKINTNASSYTINIYRMGYYNGAGARKVASILPSAPLPQYQPACVSQAQTGLIDCGTWQVSASWNVPATAVSGIYFARLRRTDTGGSSHIVFVVRDDSSRSDLIFQTSDTTWQAYNRYGGNSLYVGGPGTNPSRAYKLSYNRPFTTRLTEPEDWVFNAEYPMVRFLEQNGYDVTYFTGIDADRRGADILNHKTYLSVGHDEYWTKAQRDNVETARAAGVNLAFFSGNEVSWKIRYEDSIDGSHTPYRTLTCYKDYLTSSPRDPQFPPVWTGLWSDKQWAASGDHEGKAENALSGQLFVTSDGNGRTMKISLPYNKFRLWRNSSAFNLLAGQSKTLGSGIIGYEWDSDMDNGLRPAGLSHMSSTIVDNIKIVDVNEHWYTGQAKHTLTIYRHSSGALVFAAGTVQWAWGLDGNHDRGGSIADLDVQQATVNILADMSAQSRTLKAGLVQTTESTDVTGPTTIITSPADGATVANGAKLVVSGTASDVGGLVAAVEVSTNNGGRWYKAEGWNTWSHPWVVTGATTILVRAADDSGNIGPASAVSITVGAPEVVPPTVAITSPAANSVVSGTTTVSANAADASGVAGVQFQIDGVNLGAEDTTQPYSVSWNTTGYTSAQHTVTARARDTANNSASTSIAVTINNASSGLAAAYGFNEAAGATVLDASGNGNAGTIANATRVAGKFGAALSFNGVNSLVSIPDSNSLDLTSRMTLEAWVYPTAINTSARTIVMKERSTNSRTYTLYTANGGSQPPSFVMYVSGYTRTLIGPTSAILPLNKWSHVAATYSGSTQRLYVNGVQVASRSQTGSASTSTNPFRIGGSLIRGEYFSGLIDEVRIYNRSLSAAEIMTDMNKPIQ